ncbi:DUF1264-domain-containing protein [Neolentinus lepideus HHB14362 ss-1]|uniref:DUF1264-domain-containing protein n=1 Tax=Neolentinus lepideus HHB14362 ss-1 TaxID=1314782 RepID=A0A165VJM5_9AGAM|nr:DUF1264-domain-containing protein [Neolentinus lepideus HHB14362 ss-1]
MDTETKNSAYHTSAYTAAGEVMMSFKPINAIHQHLCAFHVYAHDRTRHVEAHHYCTHRTHDLHQCVIYDSDEPNAKLIGIEYVVSEKIFSSLPPEEKKYWHSHKYEVESGLLQIQAKGAVPGVVTDVAEQPAMLELQKTYGKTIHTWAIDETPELPLGPPNLMMAYTADGQIPPELVKQRDQKWGMDTEAKRQLRAGYLPEYQPLDGADDWQSTGKGVVFEPVLRDLKK